MVRYMWELADRSMSIRPGRKGLRAYGGEGVEEDWEDREDWKEKERVEMSIMVHGVCGMDDMIDEG